jgi:hypothetical protein
MIDLRAGITFSSFLAAGSARVVAPVRPGFELALDHFLQTGQIWNRGALPAIGQELYVPIIDELRRASARREPKSRKANHGMFVFRPTW